MKLSFRAQSIMEYVLVIGLVSIALGAIQSYTRRGVQSIIKVSTDRLGNQTDYTKREKNDYEISNPVQYTATSAMDYTRRQNLEVRDVSQGQVRDRMASFQVGEALSETYQGARVDKRLE
ncbi:hypothetical protein ACFL2W_00770 [Candidatus Omnitrophota bacterium]